MSTTGTYTDHPNNLVTISAALRKINRLGDFETLSTSDPRYLSADAALHLICKEFATMGMPLWAMEEVAIPMSNFTTISGITIGLSGATITQVTPLKITQALRRDTSSNIDVPMEMYTQDYYNSLSMKAATGAPVGYCYYPLGPASSTNAAFGRLKMWPLPDSYWTTNGSIYIRYQRPFQDVGASTKDLDFPQEWSRAIVYALAYDLAPEYGLDMTQRGLLKGDRDMLLERAMGFGTEQGSFNIQPRLR